VTHVITGACCKDAACVSVCPVDCIHPAPGEPDYASAEMLYIDPATCIDCEACIDVCPVDAVSEDYRLTDDVAAFERLADLYFAAPAPAPSAEEHLVWPPSVAPRVDLGPRPRVAVVGSGPAGMYAVASLLEVFDEEVVVDLIEALPTPGGLIRYGVAPDHPETKQVSDVLESLLNHPNVVSYFGIAVGRDVSHAELISTHDAVLYAVGAPRGRRPPLPGVDLAGSLGSPSRCGRSPASRTRRSCSLRSRRPTS